MCCLRPLALLSLLRLNFCVEGLVAFDARLTSGGQVLLRFLQHILGEEILLALGHIGSSRDGAFVYRRVCSLVHVLVRRIVNRADAVFVEADESIRHSLGLTQSVIHIPLVKPDCGQPLLVASALHLLRRRHLIQIGQ